MTTTLMSGSSSGSAILSRPRDAAPVQAFVEKFLQALDDAGVPYCLLRNRDLVPKGLLEWTDIDVMISESVPRQRIIEMFAHLDPITISPRTSGHTSIFFAVARRAVRVDIFHGDVEWRGATYGKNSGILDRRWNDDGIVVASKLDQAILVWFEKLIRNRTFVPRYEPIITEAYYAQPEEFRRRLNSIVGASLTNQLIELIESGALPDCISLALACRRSLWINAFRRHPVLTLGRYIHQIGDAVNHRLNPPGLNVAILGPDGVGKSSACTSIANLPSRRIPFGGATYVRLYHRMLPTLGDLQTRSLHIPKLVERDPAKPQGMPTLHPLIWLGVYAYYTFDHWLGEVFWSRQKVAHMMLILHDRHPVEVVIDPLRYRYQGPMFLPRTMAWLTPRPDLTIILDAPADIIQGRKQELTLDELRRQREAYRTLALTAPNGRVVNANQPTENVLEDVIGTIVSFSRDRSRKRFLMLLAREEGDPWLPSSH